MKFTKCSTLRKAQKLDLHAVAFQFKRPESVIFVGIKKTREKTENGLH